MFVGEKGRIQGRIMSPNPDATEEKQNQGPHKETLSDGTEPKHLLLVNYENEAERNRASQIIKEHGEGRAKRPQGTIRYLHPGTDLEALTEELLVRLPAQHVHLFEIDEVDISGPSTTKDVLEYEFDEPQDSIENLLNFIITNQGGRMITPSERRYEITSRKGRVEAWFETDSENQSVKVYFEGHPKPIEHLKESFRESFKQAG